MKMLDEHNPFVKNLRTAREKLRDHPKENNKDTTLYTLLLNFTICLTKLSTLSLGPFIWIWESKCANKIKVFTWLLLMDRLNVRNIPRRKKHKLQGNNYSYVLCSSQCKETTFHLFFSCPLSLWCWQHLNIN
jgi:hypothetical protein